MPSISTLSVEAAGSIGELNATIGYARAFCDDAAIAALARSIQRDLFPVGSAISTKPDARRPIPTIEKAMVTRLDEAVATLEAEPGILRDWSISGEYRGSAAFDLARTVERRARAGVDARLRDEQHPGPPWSRAW